MPSAQVVVVDGGSSDDTAQVARRHGAQVLHQTGRGYADALRTGYRAALDGEVPWLVQLDADGQHPPQAAALVAGALRHADWVVGTRDGTGSPGPMGRRVGAAVLCRTLRLSWGLPVTDPTSGLQGLNRTAMQCFANALPDEAPDTGARVLAARARLRYREVPVYMPERDEGESMHSGWHGLRNGLRSWRVAAMGPSR